MKFNLLLFVLLFLASLQSLAQPYSGTIFVDSDIIVAADSSAFVDVSYTGQGTKTIFDRRVNDWITVNAYLFDVVWNDGLSSVAVINPEFANEDLAEIEAEKYGRSIGQLPHCLRVDVNEIWINKGVELFGGGNNSILIHTGQTVLYENDGILEETLVHEASHTSLDAAHKNSAGWLNAQAMDNGFISDYAEEFPDREDIAESFLMWMAVRYRQDKISTQDYNLITEAIPNRLEYFDNIVCNLAPFHLEIINSTIANAEVDNAFQIYGNPTIDMIELRTEASDKWQMRIYDARGKPIQSGWLTGSQNIDFSNYPAGTYLIVLHGAHRIERHRVLKI